MRRSLKSLMSIMALATALLTCSMTSHAGAGNETASVMRLEKTIGDVQVTSSSGKASQIIEKMRLSSGDDVKSAAKSYAYISLDDSKAVKLDARSEATIKKNGKKYEVSLESGNLIFNVEKELGSDESFEIKTATMTMGIRGTCAQVERKSSNETGITLLNGTLSCSITDPATGKSKSVQLKAGEHADLYTGDGCRIVTRKVVLEDLKGFSLQYLLDNRATLQKIFDQTGLDLRGLTRQQADSRLALDEDGVEPEVNTGRTSPSAAWYKEHP